MSMIRNVTFAMSLAILAGPSMRAADVSTDYDHHADFRSYHTFSFYKVQTSDPLYERRVRDEVSKDLAQAGWRMVDRGGDVAITAIGGVHDTQEYNSFYDGLGGDGWGWGGWGGWGGGWGTTQTSVQQIPVGTLMLDMYDSHTHQLIWRGRSSSDLSNNSEKNTKTIDKDIDKMLNGFPPKPRG